MREMYPAAVNSVATELASDINATQTTITLVDASVIPEAPNLLTIGHGENAETVRYGGKSGNQITSVTRGFQGSAESWAAGSIVARYYTAYDAEAVRENITNVSLELTDKPSYEDSLIKLLHNHSALKETVLVKARNATTIDIAVQHGENRVTVYTMIPDGDGWWRLRDVVVRSLTRTEVQENKNQHKNYDSDTGTWNKQSPPNFFATQAGATFTATFWGTGCKFASRVDNRGGVWEFVIDGVHTKTISTYSSVDTSNVLHDVVKGLKQGEHTIVATFKGDDPANPPSGGAGTSRGWCNHNTNPASTSFKTIVPIIETYTEGNGTPVMQASSRKEFAFSVRPAEAAYNPEWVPEHGVLGVMKDLNMEIYFGNRKITDVSQESNYYRDYPSVRFVTRYNAYHPKDPSPLWNGRIDQTINGKGFNIMGKMKFLRDTYIDLSYPGMLAISKNDTDNDRVVTGKSQRYVLPKEVNDGSNVDLGITASVAHFTHESAKQDVLNIVAVIELYDHKRALRLGQRGQAFKPVRVDLRTDGQRKTYMAGHQKYTAQTGEGYAFGCSYFVGEVINASEILP